MFGKLKKEWLSTFLELPNGIPSHDTFNRFFAALNPQVLQQCFLNWIQQVARITEGRIISIDGRRSCGSGTQGTCHVIDDIDWVCSNKEWKGLKRLIKITAERTDKSSGEQSKECRYYISSAALKAEELSNATRQHWGIENKLHWMLDVNFSEDASRKKAGNAAQNFR